METPIYFSLQKPLSREILRTLIPSATDKLFLPTYRATSGEAWVTLEVPVKKNSEPVKLLIRHLEYGGIFEVNEFIDHGLFPLMSGSAVYQTQRPVPQTFSPSRVSKSASVKVLLGIGVSFEITCNHAPKESVGWMTNEQHFKHVAAELGSRISQISEEMWLRVKYDRPMDELL